MSPVHEVHPTGVHSVDCAMAAKVLIEQLRKHFGTEKEVGRLLIDSVVSSCEAFCS